MHKNGVFMNEDIKACISNIQHFCMHDGEGFRTTVFFQGCLLRCKWCQNPETQNIMPVMMYRQELCAKCMKCVESCVFGALSYRNGIFHYDNTKCMYCLACEQECYFEARSFSGHYMTLDEIYSECIQDEYFYTRGGGGITLSGGEPLLQKDFVKKLASKLKEKNIHVTIETAGFVEWQNIVDVASNIDCFLYDVKVVSNHKQKCYLGCDIDRSLQNMKKLSEVHSNIIARIPLIPGINDTPEEFSRIVDFIQTIKTIKTIHLLPYHSFGNTKYRMIGKTTELEHLPEDNRIRISACAEFAKKRNYDVKVIGSDNKYTFKENIYEISFR